MEFDTVPGVASDRDGTSIGCWAAVGHDGVVTRTVPVQNAELSAHAQGLRDGVSHHHMRGVVLVERDQEISVVPSVDVTATPEGSQIIQTEEYVVVESTSRHNLERVGARMGLGGVDGGGAAALSGDDDTPHTAVDGAFKVGSNRSF